MAKTAAGDIQTNRQPVVGREAAAARPILTSARRQLSNSKRFLDPEVMLEVSARVAHNCVHHEPPSDRDWALASAALSALVFDRDAETAARFVRAVAGRHRDAFAAQVALFESAERHLGDCWRADERTEFDIVIAVSTLLRAFRSLNATPAQAWPSPLMAPLVLVAPWPGETHLLPAVMSAEVLWREGWGPIVACPPDDEGLEDALADHAYDAAVLTLSGVFTRVHWVADVAHTIRRARRASKNPNVIIAVTGRAVADLKDELRALDADVLAVSACDVPAQISQVIARRAH